MKKRLVMGAVLMIGLFLLNSCAPMQTFGNILGKVTGELYAAVYGTDESRSIEKLGELLTAVEEGNKEAISALFSKTAKEQQDSFEEAAEDLIQYFEGFYTSASMTHGGPSTETRRDGNAKFKSYFCSFYVVTTETAYRVRMDWIGMDTYEGGEANVGITSFYIIRAEDDIHLGSAYSGDGEDSPGIHIGVQNTWPDRRDALTGDCCWDSDIWQDDDDFITE